MGLPAYPPKKHGKSCHGMELLGGKSLENQWILLDFPPTMAFEGTRTGKDRGGPPSMMFLGPGAVHVPHKCSYGYYA